MKNIIKSILFITWFFGTFISMLIFKNNLFIELLLFGQFFLIIGIFALIKSKGNVKKYILLIFPLIGIGCIIISLLNILGNIDLNKIIPYTISSVFIFYGLLEIIILKTYNTYLKKKCTEKIFGEVVDIDRHCSDNHHFLLSPIREVVDIDLHYSDNHHFLLSPIYEINYNGEKIRIKPDEYNNLYKYKIGQVDTLFINPSNPNEFIYPTKRIIIFTYLISTLCILGGIIPILFMLKIL